MPLRAVVVRRVLLLRELEDVAAPPAPDPPAPPPSSRSTIPLPSAPALLIRDRRELILGRFEWVCDLSGDLSCGCSLSSSLNPRRVNCFM